MTRGFAAANLTETQQPSLTQIVLAALEFGTPVYAHSGVGTIPFDSNDYLGVGDLGAVDTIEESEDIIASPIVLTLSGIDGTLVAEALDSGNYGDIVTVYEGYRQDDGTLVADPEVIARGFFEHATLVRGSDNSISVTARNELLTLEEKDGSRFSDEDQRQRYPTDEGFEYVTDNRHVSLVWGGGRAGNNGGSGAGIDADSFER